jgi:hypothetical protein
MEKRHSADATVQFIVSSLAKGIPIMPYAAEELPKANIYLINTGAAIHNGKTILISNDKDDAVYSLLARMGETVRLSNDSTFCYVNSHIDIYSARYPFAGPMKSQLGIALFISQQKTEKPILKRANRDDIGKLLDVGETDRNRFLAHLEGVRAYSFTPRFAQGYYTAAERQRDDVDNYRALLPIFSP